MEEIFGWIGGPIPPLPHTHTHTPHHITPHTTDTHIYTHTHT